MIRIGNGNIYDDQDLSEILAYYDSLKNCEIGLGRKSSKDKLFFARNFIESLKEYNKRVPDYVARSIRDNGGLDIEELEEKCLEIIEKEKK